MVPALSTWTPEDGVLGAVAPLALAAGFGTALVVDLDPAGPAYPSEGSLAHLISAGPRAADLAPTRAGVAVLRNGGVDRTQAAPVLAALLAGWPAVVLRLPPWPPPESLRGVVPVRPLTPAGVLGASAAPAVYQRGPFRVDPVPDGIVLPRPASSTVRGLLAGRRPLPGRWLRAWRRVWEVSWS